MTCAVGFWDLYAISQHLFLASVALIIHQDLVLTMEESDWPFPAHPKDCYQGLGSLFPTLIPVNPDIVRSFSRSS